MALTFSKTHLTSLIRARRRLTVNFFYVHSWSVWGFRYHTLLLSRKEDSLLIKMLRTYSSQTFIKGAKRQTFGKNHHSLVLYFLLSPTRISTSACCVDRAQGRGVSFLIYAGDIQIYCSLGSVTCWWMQTIQWNI